jgi:hypothetical protein
MAQRSMAQRSIEPCPVEPCPVARCLGGGPKRPSGRGRSLGARRLFSPAPLDLLALGLLGLLALLVQLALPSPLLAQTAGAPATGPSAAEGVIAVPPPAAVKAAKAQADMMETYGGKMEPHRPARPHKPAPPVEHGRTFPPYPDIWRWDIPKPEGFHSAAEAYQHFAYFGFDEDDGDIMIVAHGFEPKQGWSYSVFKNKFEWLGFDRAHALVERLWSRLLPSNRAWITPGGQKIVQYFNNYQSGKCYTTIRARDLVYPQAGNKDLFQEKFILLYSDPPRRPIIPTYCDSPKIRAKFEFDEYVHTLSLELFPLKDGTALGISIEEGMMIRLKPNYTSPAFDNQTLFVMDGRDLRKITGSLDLSDEHKQAHEIVRAHLDKIRKPAKPAPPN